MRVSIFVPVRNNVKGLRRCLESIVAQTYSDIEVVVSDCKSTDGTIDVLREFEARLGDRLVWRSEQDGGAGEAMNWSIKHASGDWMLMLGADDMLAGSDVITELSRVFASAAPARRIIVGHVVMVDESGRTIEALDKPWSVPYLPENGRSFSAFLWHRSLFAECGPIDETLAMNDDVDFMLRALKRTEAIYLRGQPIAHMAIGGRSTDRKFAVCQYFHILKVHRRHYGPVPIQMYWRFMKACAIQGLNGLFGDRFTLRVTNVYRRVAGGRPPLQY